VVLVDLVAACLKFDLFEYSEVLQLFGQDDEHESTLGKYRLSKSLL